MAGWSERTAADPRLTVGARVAVIVLTLFAAPAAGWSISQIIDQGRINAVQEQRLTEMEKRAITYTSEDARRDLALRDVQINQMSEALDKLIRVVDAVQEKQSSTYPLFQQLLGRVDRLEDRVFNAPAIQPTAPLR